MTHIPPSLVLLSLCLFHVGEGSFITRKRGTDDDAHSALLKSIKDVPIEAYLEDRIFTQKVDKLNGISKYTLEGEDAPAYERNEDDNGKDVVILKEEEDKLPIRGVKNVFIVLKKVGEGGKYAAIVARIRDAQPADEEPVTVGGKKKLIEWGTFDPHFIHGRPLPPYLLGVCASSMMVNCLINVSVLVPPENFLKHEPFQPHVGSKADQAEGDKTEWKTPDGSDHNENYNFFSDLEDRTLEGRGLSDMLGGGLLPGLFGGISGGLCTALAVVGICGHGQGSTDLTVINQSGQPFDQSMMQAMTGGGGGGYPPPGYPPPPGYGRRKRRDAAPGTAKDYPGWKTQYGKISKGTSSAVDASIPFYGVGNCPYSKPNEDWLSSSQTADVVNFYRHVLRTDCLTPVGLIWNSYVSVGVLQTTGPTFELKKDHRLLIHAKISLPETLILFGATEVDAFTHAYQDVRANKLTIPTSTPDEKRKLSKSTAFLGKVFLNQLRIGREKVRNHLITVRRGLVVNLSNTYVKLAQDAQNLGPCGDCGEEKEVNLNDRIYVTALNIFMKRGLAVGGADLDVGKLFDTFYKDNAEKFEKIVKLYS